MTVINVTKKWHLLDILRLGLSSGSKEPRLSEVSALGQVSVLQVTADCGVLLVPASDVWEIILQRENPSERIVTLIDYGRIFFPLEKEAYSAQLAKVQTRGRAVDQTEHSVCSCGCCSLN